MGKSRTGLYETLVTHALEAQLAVLEGRFVIVRDPLSPEEAPDRIALHLGQLLRRAISGLDREKRTRIGLQMAAEIIGVLMRDGEVVDVDDLPSPAGELLRAIAARRPDGSVADVVLPMTPLLDTTLLTNAPGEPRIGAQLQSELPSADRIDVLMAFIRKSGIHPLLDRLRAHVDQGRSLRLLTTTYTGSTELAALDALCDIGAKVRVSYDTSSTRLHAKAWLFHRESGYSTAYIGSSNLTHSAMQPGLEWNVRLSGARNPDVIDKFSAVFESYWNSVDFRDFDRDEFRELTRLRETGPRVFLSPVEIRPEPFQSRLLEQIALARLQGHHANLLVAATGTGKTVMAALDYQRLRALLPRARLLFVAHRRELLEQSLATFRHALRDAAFGELWVGGVRPDRFEHVFASIQSLSATGLDDLAPDHFDIVIVDEFHHAAARTYDALLRHLRPRELLGLTATPERGDEASVLHWFDGRIAAELRLWDAIDQNRLCPFSYYGISDGVDYRQVSWTRGRGYDVSELSGLLTGDHVLARRIIQAVSDHVADAGTMRALGFCVSVEHARFMARQFSAAGLSSVEISAASSTEQRHDALAGLAQGTLRVVFSVDLFNEGVDIPSVDTLILLRPTDSSTLFLQQLGRGLRREVGKTMCTVLDFVGHHRKEFRLHRRFQALLGGSRSQLQKQVEQGFPFLPSGCHMELDAVAAEQVLENIRLSLPSTFKGRWQEMLRVAEGADRITLKAFLDGSGLTLEDVYANNYSWSDLLVAGGLAVLPEGPAEKSLRRGLGRLVHVDDSLRIDFCRRLSASPVAPEIETMKPMERRLLQMLAAVLMESIARAPATLAESLALLWQHPQVLAELGQLMAVLSDRVDHLQAPLSGHDAVPLRIHARYTRREILAAFGDGVSTKVPEWREGVRWLPDQGLDLLAITLDKRGGQFSPTTRYRDYAISPTLLHWESQSATREGSPTGQRYQGKGPDRSVSLPFVRLDPAERAFWLLGPAHYVSHVGERPMAITWRLDHALPGDLYARFAAAVA